jgi:D-glucuronyl C5-epimerase C-terminus
MRGFLLVSIGALGLAAAAAPARSPLPAQRLALHAVAQAARTGRIDAATAAGARSEIGRAAHLVRTLPSGRREHVGVALGELASFDGRLTEPRTLLLVGELKANDDYFSKHWAPAPKTDIVGDDGLVYRYFAGRCLEFHPLAEFSALNEHVAEGDADATRELADALVARGVYQQGGGVGWEYPFPFSSGRAPWLSGMAQAVGAQAFARAAALVPEEAPGYLREARAAYALIPKRLLTTVPAGPWIKLYAFDRTPVLNAQLQAVLSLQSYAAAAEDAGASALAARMERAAAATLPAFDTGYWTYYSLAHDPSPLDYQQYVVSLLKRLASADPRFADAATRFDAYDHQPPAFHVGNAGLRQLRLWLSKPAILRIDTAAGPSRRISLGGGWHTLTWQEPKRPGLYAIHVQATDWAGNHASFDALPFVRATQSGAKIIAGGTVGGGAGATAFAVGAGLDDPSQGSTLQRLGLRLARLEVAWPVGATAPDPTVVTALQRLPASLGTVLELDAGTLPADDAGRAALVQYAATLATQAPSLHTLVLQPAPTVATAAAYATVFAAVRSAVQAAVPGAAVALALDGNATPKATIAALGPITADGVAFKPAPTRARGAWTTADIPQLTATLPLPVLLDGPPVPVSAGTITAASCTPGIAGVLLGRLSDATGAVAAASTTAQRGAVVCPGLAVQAEPSSLTYPDSLAAPVTVGLACDRDCLYLVTLERSDGRPVVATRGALQGGAAPASIALPKAALVTGGRYRIVVRLLAQVNPGHVTQLESPALAAG